MKRLYIIAFEYLNDRTKLQNDFIVKEKPEPYSRALNPLAFQSSVVAWIWFRLPFAYLLALRQSIQQTTQNTINSKQAVDMDQNAICRGCLGSHQY